MALDFKAKLIELENLLKKIDHPILENYDSGIPRDLQKQIVGHLGFDFPQEFYQLFEWRNGVKEHNENKRLSALWLFPLGALHNVSGAEAYYQSWLKDLPEYVYGKFPIFQSGGGEQFMLDVDPRSPTYCMVHYFTIEPEDFDYTISFFDSLNTWVDTMIECYAQKALYVENGRTAQNRPLRYEISIKHNPRSNYWKLVR